MNLTLLLVLAVVVVGGIAVFAYLADKKRRERLMQYALMRGWTYAGEDSSLVGRWQGEPFGRGDHQRAQNVLTGSESGRGFTAFDYSYQTHSTDSKGNRSTTTHRWTVCAVPMPAWLGVVQVVPESVFDRMASAVGLMHDIDLESEDFNRRYRVTAGDPKLASDLLPPRTMEYLLTVDVGGWRTCGGDIVGFREGRLDPLELVKTAAVLGRVLDGVPAFVWKDAGAAGTEYSPGP